MLFTRILIGLLSMLFWMKLPVFLILLTLWLDQPVRWPSDWPIISLPIHNRFISLRSVCPGTWTLWSLPGDMGPGFDRTDPGDDMLAWDREASESLFSLPLPLPSSPLELWVFTCLDKWSDLMNLLLHMGQANLFSPVCVLRCLCSSSDLVNLFPQNNQLHTKGRSPVCHLRCAFKWEVFP